MDLIKAKRSGKAPPMVSEERPSNVINLMEALRRSARGNKSRSSSSSGRKTGKRRSSGRERTATSKKKVRRAS